MSTCTVLGSSAGPGAPATLQPAVVALTVNRARRGSFKRMRYAVYPLGEKWFARKDSNLDFQGQNLTCYHCTTGE